MNTTLNKFKIHSEQWHRAVPHMHDYRGRANVVSHFVSRFGVEAVLRHKRQIVEVLNRVEGMQPVHWNLARN